MERSSQESHTTIGTMERANRTLGEVLRTLKHAIETRVGGRPETDQLICCMVRHCCCILCRYQMSSDGRNSFEMLRCGSYRGRLTCLGRIVWTRILGSRLLQGWLEANRLELVWLAMTENTEENSGMTNTGYAISKRSNDCPNQPDGDKNLPTS